MTETNDQAAENSRELAALALTAWTVESRKLQVRRDSVVRAGYRAGIRKTMIAEITGLSRSTIDRILISRHSELLALYGPESHADGRDPL
jgi:hypothetical protein